jgi:hypothetical protein
VQRFRCTIRFPANLASVVVRDGVGHEFLHSCRSKPPETSSWLPGSALTFMLLNTFLGAQTPGPGARLELKEDEQISTNGVWPRRPNSTDNSEYPCLNSQIPSFAHRWVDKGDCVGRTDHSTTQTFGGQPNDHFFKGSLDRSIPHVMYWLGRFLQFLELAELSLGASPAQG